MGCVLGGERCSVVVSAGGGAVCVGRRHGCSTEVAPVAAAAARKVAERWCLAVYGAGCRLCGESESDMAVAAAVEAGRRPAWPSYLVPPVNIWRVLGSVGGAGVSSLLGMGFPRTWPCGCEGRRNLPFKMATGAVLGASKDLDLRYRVLASTAKPATALSASRRVSASAAKFGRRKEQGRPGASTTVGRYIREGRTSSSSRPWRRQREGLSHLICAANQCPLSVPSPNFWKGMEVWSATPQTAPQNVSSTATFTAGQMPDTRDTRRPVMDTTLVKDLSPRGFQWKTIVCVARIWEHRDQATWQNLFEVDFIVIDQEGNKMEGCIPANRIDQFRDKIKEGSIHRFQPFIVAAARSKYRATYHPYRIKITQRKGYRFDSSA